MHDYSDAIAIVGLNNVTNAINIPTGHEKVQGDIEHTGDNTQTGDYNLTGTQTINDGKLIIPSTSDIEIDGISIRDFITDHTHDQGNDSDGDVQQTTDEPNALP